MLCLTTRMVPWDDGELEQRIRTLLDVQIPGIILSHEDPLDHWVFMVREIRGAKHAVPAATVPAPGKPFLPGQPHLLPHLDAIEESESRHALESVLHCLRHAEDLEIPSLILSPLTLPLSSQTQQLQRKHADWFQQRRALLKSIPKEDIDTIADIETRIRFLLEEYLRFFTQWQQTVAPLTHRKDGLLRNLEKILDEADRRGTQILLRESRDPSTPLQREDLSEVFERFSGAPLGHVLDPAAEAANRDMQGLESADVRESPLQQAAGLLLSNLDDSFRETLPLSGILEPDLLFCSDGAPISCPLHILDPAPKTSLSDLANAVVDIRNGGLDGKPAPEPGEPWKLF